PYFERSGADHIDSPFLATSDHPLGVGDTPAAGEPVEGSREWYRLQPIDDRAVDPAHPATLGEVFLRARTDPIGTVQQQVSQIAHDLSGRLDEQHVIKYRGVWHPSYIGGADKINFHGEILRNGEPVGRVEMTARLEGERGLRVSASVNDAPTGPGLDRAHLFPALRTTLEPYFERSGADHI
ncbi:hypothetical protein, partial [Mycobacterium sp. SP-6446]|uniref:hypothetical protein n=1 Tax=Mycobacterium sp. SP-6446 TaxID=1834162 RepID=UPI00158C91BB